jgi:hypothetical protein
MARVDEDRTIAIVACAGVVLLALVATKKVLDSPAKGKDQSSLGRLFRISSGVVELSLRAAATTSPAVCPL